MIKQKPNRPENNNKWLRIPGGMIEKFKKFISENQLFEKEDKILLAVSGGIDSMVMGDLFIKSGYSFGIAHCNFKLREEESDSDQMFVSEFASSRKVPFYSISFDTKIHAMENGISVQMAARDLRYNWLKETRNKNNYDYVAIGHNRDDSIETFFINLIRGTGLHGLSGISVKNGDIIRPILFASRKEIVDYSKKNGINYREDSSNSGTKYLRNKIRHILIPEFEKLTPVFRDKMIETIGNLQQSEKLAEEVINSYRQKIVNEKDDRITIDYTYIVDNNNFKILLFEIIKQYGFNSDQVDLICESVNSSSGKQFFSSSHRLVKDRNKFLITGHNTTFENRFIIDENVESIAAPIRLNFIKSDVKPGFIVPSELNTAAFDLDKLKFPLELRKWEKGDRFMPLGMKNFKKVSDFFTDHKFSLPDKEKTWILTTGGEILWIVNYRLDDRYKVTPESTRVLIIQPRTNE